MSKIAEYIENIMLVFKPYLAKNSIVQADGDSGDSAQRVGHFFALSKLATANQQVISYESAINAHTISPGVYKRSTDDSHWGSNPDNFSRDQWQALQLAFAAHNDKKRLCESMMALLKRGLLHQNSREGTDGNKLKFPDIAHPSHFSVFIRGMNLWFLWPILWLFDVCFLADLFFRKYATDYDNMLAPQMLYANVKYATPVSKLAMKLYVQTDFINKLEKYHSVQRNGILPFPALFWAAYAYHKYLPYSDKAGRQ